MTYVARYEVKDPSSKPPNKLEKQKDTCVMELMRISKYQNASIYYALVSYMEADYDV